MLTARVIPIFGSRSALARALGLKGVNGHYIPLRHRARVIELAEQINPAAAAKLRAEMQAQADAQAKDKPDPVRIIMDDATFSAFLLKLHHPKKQKGGKR